MEWLTYLLKVTACTALFYLVYYFFLQKLTFFSVNRTYLLSTLLISFVIPVLQFDVKLPATKLMAGPSMPAIQAAKETIIPVQNQSATKYVVIDSAATDWREVVPRVYWLLAGAALTMFFYQLTLLIWHSRKVSDRSGILKLVDKPKGFTDCSFFNYVFIDKNKTPDAILAILQHERVHALKLHSLDKILVSLCKSFLWFNPFIYLYDKALEQVHEYEADKETSFVIGNTVYANMLLTLAANTKHSPLAHSFMKNPVKERIKMLFTNPSKSMKKLIYLALVPACLALVCLFGVQVVYAETSPKAPGNLPTNQGVTEYRVNQARPELTISKPNEDSKQALPDTKKESEAPLRLIDNVELGENPLVFIDGKEYSAEILTRISPACMSMAKFSPGKAEISTRKNQIEYATKAEIETAKIRRQVKAKGKFYSRYPVTINGHKRDEILVRFGSHFTEGSFPVGYRIALSMNGKIFSEKEALEMEGNYAYNMTGINYRYIKEEPELFSKYGDEYDLILQFKSADTGLKSQRSGVIPGSSKITSQSGDEKFEYRATDSVAYSGNNQFITLFGNAEIINGRRSTVAGDKIRFDAKARTAIVQNARVTFQGKKKTIEGALVKVDIDKGTYEMLSGTPEF